MTVNVERLDGGVAVVTLLAESAQNAFSIESINQISTILNSLMDDDEICAYVLTGSEKFFCAGADINQFRACYDDGTIAELVRGLTDILHPLLVRIRQSDTIYVAAINGAAAGGGLGLALTADYRIASPDAKLAAAYFSLGLSPDGGATWLLPRLVGEQKSRKFFFENETWSAIDALEVGAIDEVTNNENLVSRAIEVAEKWGKWAKASRGGTKQLLESQSYNDFSEQLKNEQDRIVDASQTEAFSEGVNAFLEKR
ncbi:MAG: enoyl-CoA hydratase/isomerase family protein [Candidatus Thalassarchaeaceae archaeon]|jgi:2-(1,2-epoxy-1,2-dihydrophenyl)acetyl-CoA isomerase|nr:enoyl-CoA hydratase/isomerase family protein [Candidatus Thalassarchaeaceae archaeon]MDP7043217.1 enoyl-CoA hydratase/isomerase family protein [Candidatus Thalassarchaeaceae archaeon]